MQKRLPFLKYEYEIATVRNNFNVVLSPFLSHCRHIAQDKTDDSATKWAREQQCDVALSSVFRTVVLSWAKCPTSAIIKFCISFKMLVANKLLNEIDTCFASRRTEKFFQRQVVATLFFSTKTIFISGRKVLSKCFCAPVGDIFPHNLLTKPPR